MFLGIILFSLKIKTKNCLDKHNFFLLDKTFNFLERIWFSKILLLRIKEFLSLTDIEIESLNS